MVKKFASCKTSVDLATIHCLYEIIVIMFDYLIFLFMHFHWLHAVNDGAMVKCVYLKVYNIVVFPSSLSHYMKRGYHMNTEEILKLRLFI